MRKGSIIFILFIGSAGLFAQKFSNEFLSIGVGARALGMSNSFISTTDDVTSGYWNPSGLVKIEKGMQVGLMHAEYFAGIAKYDYGGFATKLDEKSAFGVSLVRFGVDDIPNTTQLIDADGNIDYDKISSFSVADYGVLLSYARKSKIEGLNYGVNTKIIHRKVGDFAKSWGFGLDLGAQYDYQNWVFGLMVRDLTTTFNAWSFSLSDEVIEVFQVTGNEIPENGIEITKPKIILGVAREVKISNKFLLLSELDFDVTTDGQRNVLISNDPISVDPHMGVELGYRGMLFLRLGVGNIQKTVDIYDNEEFTYQPNFGVGIKFRGITIDYALSDIGDRSEALYSNIFSLRFDLNKGVKVVAKEKPLYDLDLKN